jgi:ABC-type multidrug transport system fused ATPase/permease subunit
MFTLLCRSNMPSTKHHLLNVIAFAFAIAHGASWPLFGVLFGQLVDTIGTPTIVPGEIQRKTRELALYMLIVGSSVIFASGAWSAILGFTSQARANDLRESVFRSLARNDMKWFDSRASSMSSIVVDRLSVAKFRSAVGSKLGFFLYNLSQGITGFAIGFIYGWQMPLVVIGCMPIIALSTMMLNRAVIASTQSAESAYMGATGVCEESIFSIKTVTAFNGQNKQIGRFTKFLNAGSKTIRAISAKLAVSYGLSNGAVFALFAISFAVGGVFIQHSVGNYNGGNVISVLVAILTGAFGFGQTSISLQAFGEAQAAMEQLEQLLASCESSIEDPNPDPSNGSDLEDFKSIEIQNVAFSYTSERNVLSNISISIPCGSRIAFVGESGSGKSSLVSLLLRFYDPSSGSILLNGKIDYREIQRVSSLRRLFGYVGQEPVLFAKTIKENLVFGLNREVSDDEMWSVLEAVNAKDFVHRLPDKLETMCGPSAGLSHLSGGQKQRIAIARALLRNPKILLLDEATSALDNESERSVIEAIRSVQARFPTLTTVSVAHRLTTVRDCDCIYVLGKREGSDGSIVLEKGSHADLMNLKSTYAALVGSQEDSKSRVVSPSKTVEKTDISPTVADNSEQGKYTETKGNSRSDPIKGKFSKLREVASIGYDKTSKFHLIPAIIGSLGKGVALPLDALIFSSVAGFYYIPDKDEMMRNVGIASAKYVGLAVGVFLATFLAIGTFSLISESVSNRLRANTFSTVMLHAPISFFDNPSNSPSVVTSTVTQASGKAASLVTTLPRVAAETLAAFIMGTIVSFTACPKLAAVLIATFPIILVASAISAAAYMGVDNTSDNGAKTEDSPEKRLVRLASETLMNMRTVRSLNGELPVITEYKAVIARLNKEAVWKSIKSGIAFGFSMGLVFWSNALGYWYGGILVSNGEINVTEMTRAILGPMLTSLAIGEALVFLPNIGESFEAMDEVLRLLTLNKDQTNGNFKLLPQTAWDSLEFKKVDFQYPTRPEKVLNQITFRLSLEGKRVALVGPSGGGKSTVISLLLRFYDPSSGEIVLNDVYNVMDMDPSAYRARIGYVGQEPVLFDMSLRENVLYGIESELSDKEQLDILEDVGQKAKLDFVESIGGWETELGPRGSKLSGGQKQRVAIARAIAKRPELLLMDEATSALDSVSESVVQDAIEGLLKSKTCRAVVIIAHRLSTVVSSDLILVVQRGRVVQIGSHKELVSDSSGPYARLYNAGLSNGAGTGQI